MILLVFFRGFSLANRARHVSTHWIVLLYSLRPLQTMCLCVFRRSMSFFIRLAFSIKSDQFGTKQGETGIFMLSCSFVVGRAISVQIKPWPTENATMLWTACRD